MMSNCSLAFWIYEASVASIDTLNEQIFKKSETTWDIMKKHKDFFNLEINEFSPNLNGWLEIWCLNDFISNSFLLRVNLVLFWNSLTKIINNMLMVHEDIVQRISNKHCKCTYYVKRVIKSIFYERGIPPLH